MKNYVMGLVIIGMLYSGYGCANNSPKSTEETATVEEAQTPAPKFEDEQLNNVYGHYIHLKTALVNEDNKEADAGAKALQAALKAASIESKYIGNVVAAKDLTGKRSKFSELSNEVADVLRKSKLASGVVYKQYCPMANDNKGGYWLANEKQIQNPFYGSKMMRCGSVEEEIK